MEWKKPYGKNIYIVQKAYTRQATLKGVSALAIQDSIFYQVNMTQQVMLQHADLHGNLKSIDKQVKSSLLSALINYTNSEHMIGDKQVQHKKHP